MEPLAPHHAFNSAMLCVTCATPFLLCYAALSYAMLCYAVLCYAMLCYAALCCAMLCYAMLCCAVLCCAMLCYAMQCNAMPCYSVSCYARSRCPTPFVLPDSLIVVCGIKPLPEWSTHQQHSSRFLPLLLNCRPACQAASPVNAVHCNVEPAPWTHAVLPRLDERPCCHWLPVPAGQCTPLTAAVPAHSAPERHKQQHNVGRWECKNRF